MDSSKTVSIVVLSYKNIQYMEECINSILIQDYPYIEIIFSDDGSEDFNESDVRSYIENNQKGNIVNCIINKNENNLGIVKNFNKAIKLSTGNYIVHISCDDAFFNNTVISNIVDFYNNNEYLIAVGYIVYFDENLENQKGYTPIPENVQYINGEAINCYKKLCEIGSFFPSPGLSYRRELIECYGLYDEEYKMVDDLSRFLYLTRSGCRIGFINNILIKYRTVGITSSNNTPSKVKLMIEKDMELIKKKEVLPYCKLIEENTNVIYKNINNIVSSQSNMFNQTTIFNGDGKVYIGEGCQFGYSLAPHFLGFHILLQARYIDSLLKIGKNSIFSNDITIIAVKEISIGDNCLIGDRVTMVDCDFHEINPLTRLNSYGKVESIFIGNNVWIGSGVTILKGVTIGDNCVIAQNSTVTHSVDENLIVAGNPAKVVRSVFEDGRSI